MILASRKKEAVTKKPRPITINSYLSQTEVFIQYSAVTISILFTLIMNTSLSLVFYNKIIVSALCTDYKAFLQPTVLDRRTTVSTWQQGSANHDKYWFYGAFTF